MKVLFVGGTGNISTAVSKLAVKNGYELYHLNRGKSLIENIPGVKTLIGDINDEANVSEILNNDSWDVVVNWIVFTPDQIERDFRLFAGKTRQYIFISSASAYQKPLLNSIVTESTPLKNPYWKYSRDKIACEDLLNKYYRENDFPITIVRPSHTYGNYIPSCFGFDHGYTMVNRMLTGKPILVPGTGLTRWTLTHANDFAKGFVGLLGHQDSIGHAFQLTSDEQLTWNQIYNEIGAAVNCTPNLVHIPVDVLYKLASKYSNGKENIDDLRGNLEGDKLTNVNFDNSKIKSFVPGFKATISFRDGVRRVVKWLNEDASRKVIGKQEDDKMDWMLKEWEQCLNNMG